MLPTSPPDPLPPRRRWHKRTKVQCCLELLARPEGATIEDLRRVTGWTTQTTFAFLSGVVRKRLKLPLISQSDYVGPRRYWIARERR